jgi:hypothetical protein
MGGLGSGGWNATGRATVESRTRLSATALKRHGGLRPGAHLLWQWSRQGERFASISVRCDGDGVVLSYAVNGENVGERVPLERRPCRFGGARVLFACPRCSRPVLHLHLWNGRFVCRHCARLTYAARRERERDRRLRAANRLRCRLGGEPGAAHPLPVRPRGMWRRTYERLVARICAHEDAAMEELAGWMTRLSRKTPARAHASCRSFW